MITIEEVNLMTYNDFLKVFGNILEHSSVLVGGLWYKKPYHSFEQFISEAEKLLDSLPQEGKNFQTLK